MEEQVNTVSEVNNEQPVTPISEPEVVKEVIESRGVDNTVNRERKRISAKEERRRKFANRRAREQRTLQRKRAKGK